MLFYSVLFHLIPPYPVLFCSVKHTGHDLLHWFHHRSVGLEPQFDEHCPGEIGQTCWDGCWERLSVPVCVSEDSLPPGSSSGWPIPTENFHSAACQQPQTLSLRERGMPSTRHFCISALPLYFCSAAQAFLNMWGSLASQGLSCPGIHHSLLAWSQEEPKEPGVRDFWKVGGGGDWRLVPVGGASWPGFSPQTLISHFLCPHTVIPLWLSW